MAIDCELDPVCRALWETRAVVVCVGEVDDVVCGCRRHRVVFVGRGWFRGRGRGRGGGFGRVGEGVLELALFHNRELAFGLGLLGLGFGLSGTD